MLDVPPAVVAVTCTVPDPAGDIALQLVEVEQLTEVAGLVPKLIDVRPSAKKPVPVTVTGVLPAAGPVFGETPVTVGTGGAT